MNRPRAAIAAAACAVLAFSTLASCSHDRQKDQAAQKTGQRLELDLVPGPHYRHSMGFLFFRFAMSPQIACWLETPDGRYIDTIYVTGKGAKKSWFGAPSAGRPEALPVWSHAKGSAAPSVDAVSGATPAGSVQASFPVAATLPPGAYAVRLEINSSFDYNERYTRASAGVNGQPSLIYSGTITVGKGEAEENLVPVGTGSVDGSDGNVTPGLDGITTALDMLQSVRIVYRDR